MVIHQQIYSNIYPLTPSNFGSKQRSRIQKQNPPRHILRYSDTNYSLCPWALEGAIHTIIRFGVAPSVLPLWRGAAFLIILIPRLRSIRKIQRLIRLKRDYHNLWKLAICEELLRLIDMGLVGTDTIAIGVFDFGRQVEIQHVVN